MAIFKSEISYDISYANQTDTIPFNFKKEDFYNEYSGLSLTSRCWYISLCGIFSGFNGPNEYMRAEIDIQKRLHLNKEVLKKMLVDGLDKESELTVYNTLGLKNTSLTITDEYTTFKNIYDLLNLHGPLILNRKALGSNSIHSVVIKGITSSPSKNLIQVLDSMIPNVKSQYYEFEDLEEYNGSKYMNILYSPRRYFFNILSNKLKYPRYK